MEEIRAEELFQSVQTTITIDVEKCAQEDAYNQQPNSNATSLCSTERIITHSFTDRLNQERVHATTVLGNLETERSRLSIDGILEEAHAIPEQINTDVNTELRASHSELVRLQIAEQQAYSAKQIFMKENKLNRPAYYTESKVFSIAALASIILVESVGNAYFFATGSELGYFGGVLQAILVSVANVVVIAGIGGTMAARYCNHVSVHRRTVACIGLGLFFISTCIFNLLVAHYRTALQLTPETAITDAIQLFTTHTFALANFDAWILFVIGLGAAIFTGYKWYTMDDTYPGYGKVDRQHKQAQKDYQAAERRIQDRIAELFDQANKKIADCATKLDQTIQQYQALLHCSQSIAERYPAYHQHVQHICNQVINNYRRVNKKIRATPSPAYFNDSVTINDPGMIGKNWKTEDQRLKQLQMSREKFLTATRREIGDKLRAIRENANQQLQSYFQAIIQEAQQRDNKQTEASE